MDENDFMLETGAETIRELFRNILDNEIELN